MITLRKSHERGHVDIGWLKSAHSFSFGEYFDPAHMGFRSLRVINDDLIEGGQGFGMHPHRDMEIVSYIVSGELQHKDSMGNGAVIRRGEVQAMSAGTGLLHSEFNPSPNTTARLLQIWIQPSKKGLKPGWDQKRFSDEELANQLRPVASGRGAAGALAINQDADVLASRLGAGKAVEHALGSARHAWLQVASGSVLLNGTRLDEGDAAAVSETENLKMEALSDAEFLLFDLA